MTKQSIEKDLLSAQTAISNSIAHPVIAEKLAAFGYDGPRMQEGKLLYENAQKLHLQNLKEYGEQFAATEEQNFARAEASKMYTEQLEIARVALKTQPGIASSMQLYGKRKRSLSGWLKQTRAFYTNAMNNPDIMQALAKYNLTEDKLAEGKSMADAVEAAHNNQLKETGEAQASTVARDEALDDLQDWMSDFRAIARLALKNDPQYLEILGIVEPS